MAANGIRIFMLVAVVALGAGCKSLMASITSPSDSISGSSNAIGGSFKASSDGFSQSCSGTKPSSAENAYGDDVRVYARSFVGETAPGDDFAAGLTVVAEQHGVTDWEASLMTYHALGVGLAEAGFDRDQTDAFLRDRGIADADDLVHVHEGFDVATR